MAKKFTASQVTNLDNSMVAAQDVELGTLLGGLGTHTVTASEASASSLEIESHTDEIEGWLVQISRSGSTVTEDVKITGTSGSVLTIQNGASTYVMAEDDLISYFIL